MRIMSSLRSYGCPLAVMDRLDEIFTLSSLGDAGLTTKAAVVNHPCSADLSKRAVQTLSNWLETVGGKSQEHCSGLRDSVVSLILSISVKLECSTAAPLPSHILRRVWLALRPRKMQKIAAASLSTADLIIPADPFVSTLSSIRGRGSPRGTTNDEQLAVLLAAYARGDKGFQLLDCMLAVPSAALGRRTWAPVLFADAAVAVLEDAQGHIDSLFLGLAKVFARAADALNARDFKPVSD